MAIKFNSFEVYLKLVEIRIAWSAAMDVLRVNVIMVASNTSCQCL